MKIPTYGQEVIPKGAQEQVFRSGVLRESPRQIPTLDASARSKQGVAGAMKAIGDDINQAYMQRRIAEGQVKSLDEYTKLNDEMMDPAFKQAVAYEDWDKHYRKRSTQINNKIAKDYRVRSIKGNSLLKNHLDTAQIKYGAQIENHKRTVLVNDMKFNTLNDLEKLSNEIVAANRRQDTVGMETAWKVVDGVMAGAVKAGIFSAGEAQNIFKNFQKDTQRGVFVDLIDNNPETAMTILDNWENEAVALEREIAAAVKAGDTEKAANARAKLDSMDMDLKTIDYWQAQAEAELVRRAKARKAREKEDEDMIKALQSQTAVAHWDNVTSIADKLVQSPHHLEKIDMYKELDRIQKVILVEATGQERLIDPIEAQKLMKHMEVIKRGRADSDPNRLSYYNNQISAGKIDDTLKNQLGTDFRNGRLSQKDYNGLLKNADTAGMTNARKIISSGLNARAIGNDPTFAIYKQEVEFAHAAAVKMFNDKVATADTAKLTVENINKWAMDSVRLNMPVQLKQDIDELSEELKAQRFQEVKDEFDTKTSNVITNIKVKGGHATRADAEAANREIIRLNKERERRNKEIRDHFGMKIELERLGFYQVPKNN